MAKYFSKFLLRNAANIINHGGIIAYPTEAVYGLGCNPLNYQAVERLLTIKGRSISKGFILIASDHYQLSNYVATVPNEIWERCLASWPGPVTWVLPARLNVPVWLRGVHHTIAVRVTAHPLAAMLCDMLGYPLISTSANYAGKPPLRTNLAVRRVLGNSVDMIISGSLGGAARPTSIRDALSGAILRSG